MKFNEFIHHVEKIGGIDNDGYYGKQCMDLYNYYCIKVLGTQRGETGCTYAKQIVTTDNNLRFFTKYKNTPSFVPQKGDVFVITGGRAGHVGIVIEDGTVSEFKTLEQNKRGDRRLTRETRGYRVEGELYFLRPNNQTNIERDNGGDYMARVYKNGSTVETVYQDSNCTVKIGTLNKYEQCTCIGETNGVYIVEYNIDGTNNKKVGYVKYHG